MKYAYLSKYTYLRNIPLEVRKNRLPYIMFYEATFKVHIRKVRTLSSNTLHYKRISPTFIWI